MNKKQLIYSILALFLIGLIIFGGTYAYYSFTATNNKNISFNTSKELQNYIIYNEGESKFVGDFKVSSTYTEGMHSTISLYKTSEASNVDLIATIKMDINEIGNYMKQSRALKWVVTSGTSTNVGSVLAQGNFIGVNNGDTLTLVPNLEVTTTETFYTIWIWLDENSNPSDELTGETLDVNVWTEINQVEGIEDSFEITRVNSNYQEINATIVNNKNKITSYAITTTNTEPDEWTSIDANNQSNVYNLDYTVSQTGTYYIWVKDSEGNTISRSIEVTSVDTTAPVCTWGTFTDNPIQNNTTSEITLTCIDNESEITINNLKVDNIITSNSNITVMSIARATQSNGYKYTITVKGTANDGETTLTIPANTIKNAMGLGNAVKTSSAITVSNAYTVKYQTGNSACTLNSTTYKNYEATYGTVFNIANPTCTGYTFQGWTANSGLDTTNAKYGTSQSNVTTTWSNAATKVTATWFNNLAKRDTKEVTLTANWNDSTNPTLNDITGGTSLKTNSQTLTLKCTDNIAVTAYYFGTIEPTTASSITTTTSSDLTSLQGSGLNKSVTTAGTYYLACKDAAGNFAKKSIVIRKYQVHNVLEKIAGTNNTIYTSANYETYGNVATYYIKDGTTLTLTSIYSKPTEANTFKGYTTSVPGTSAGSPSTTNPIVASNDDTVYYMWFTRLTYNVTLNSVSYGSITAETVTQTGNSKTASTNAQTLVVKYGDTVRVSANPNVGYNFTGWSGGYVSGTDNPIVGSEITASKSISASFSAKSITCPAGTYIPANSDECTACAIGSYCLGGTWTYNGYSRGLSSCPTSYTSDEGATANTLCYLLVSAGKYKTSNTGTSVANCSAGSYSEEHKSYYNSTDNVCTLCPAGTYASEAGSATCTLCPAGTYSVSEGSINSSSCNNCPTGSYSNSGANTCVACPLGQTTQSDGSGSCDKTCNNNDENVLSWVTPTFNTITTSKISKTSNVDDDGNKLSVYANNADITDTITIPGANSLSITIKYQTESTSYDWVCLYDKNTTVQTNCTGSITGKLGGKTMTTKNYIIEGDTVNIKWKTDGSGNDYLGYYATIDGSKIQMDNVCTIDSCNSNYQLVNNVCERMTTATTPTVSLKYASNNNNYTSGTWTNEAVNVLLSSTSTDIAISKFQYSNNNGESWNDVDCNISSNGSNYSCTYTYPINNSKNDTVIFRAVDGNTGKTSASSPVNIRYDIESPTGTIDYTQLKIGIQANVNAIDEFSNLTGTYEWKISTSSVCDSSTTGFISNNEPSYTFTALTEGETYYICIKVNDNVGNNGYILSEAIERMIPISYVNFGGSGNFFKASSYKNKITSIEVVDEINIPTGATSWNLGVSPSNNTDVKGWLEDDGSGSGTYALKIAAIGNMHGSGNFSNAFSDLRYVSTINLNGLSTSNISDMSYMFNYTSSVPITVNFDLGNNFNTGNVTNMYRMFNYSFINANNFALNLGNKFDTGNVTNMSDMFSGLASNASNFNINLGNKFNTINVTNMSYMFSSVGRKMPIFSLNLGNNFNTSNVINMAYMFFSIGDSSTDFNLNLGNNFNASNVTNMYRMFDSVGYNTTNFNLNLGNNFNASKVINMSDMFGGVGYKATNFNLNLGNHFNTSNVTDMSSMFDSVGCNAINFNLNLGNHFNTSNVTDMSRMFSFVGRLSANFNLNLGGNFNTINVTNMANMFDDAAANSNIINLNLGNKFNTSNVTNMSEMFAGFGSKIKIFNLNLGNQFNTINVTNMYRMFDDVGYNVTNYNLNLGNEFDTSNVTNMYSMFSAGGWVSTNYNLNLGNKFNTSKVTNMYGMFSGGGYQATNFSLNLGNHFNTINVTNMASLFYRVGSKVTNYNLNLGNEFDTSNVTDMSRMFESFGERIINYNLNLGNQFDTSNVTNMGNMFLSTGMYATNFNLNLGSKFDTSKVTNMVSMFGSVGERATNFNLNLGSSFNMTFVNDTRAMFTYVAKNSKTSFSLDLSAGNFTNITNSVGMFNNFGNNKVTIYVKDSASQNWLIGRNSAWGTNFSTTNVLIK